MKKKTFNSLKILGVMENYVKAEEEEFVPECSIEGTIEGTVVMRVKPGSKTKNLVQVRARE